ncbi:MAG: hypothetical protein HY820_43730, partial [Acidobacteria bacterium]|nr:hypothetical protein [Acidobacteriota bacterium]
MKYLCNLLISVLSMAASLAAQSSQVRILSGDAVRSVNSGEPAAPVMTSDTNGNVYVAGSLSVGMPDGSSNIVLVKYAPDGTRLWTAQFEGDGPGYKEPRTIATDTEGNVVVVAKISEDGGRNYPFAVLKFDKDGTRRWAERISVPGVSNHVPKSVGIDPAGNVYVCGEARISQTESRFILLKMNSAGGLVWGYADGSPNQINWFAALAVDPAGNVYVTGALRGNVSGEFVMQYDQITLKIDTDGALIWARQVDYASDAYGSMLWHEGQLIAIGPDGSIVVAALATLTRIGHDVGGGLVLSKYDEAGNLLWQKADADAGLFKALAIDERGNIHVTGGFKWVTATFSPDGTKLWQQALNTFGDGAKSDAKTIAVGGGGV